MGMPSFAAANAIVYLTYGAMLVMGLSVTWLFYKQTGFLSGNRTQKAIPLALNFVASGMFLFYFNRRSW